MSNRPLSYDDFPVGRPFKVREDYVKLGEEKGLILVPEVSPRSIRTPTTWKCKHCGGFRYSSYHTVKHRPHGCRCQHQSTPKEVYDAIGKFFGIRLVGSPPRSNKVPATWLDFYGNEFSVPLVMLTNNPHANVRKVLRDKVSPRLLTEPIPRNMTEFKELLGIE